MNVCLIIPHYNHHVAFSDFLPKLLACDLPIVIVDDGSSDESLSALEPLLENNAQVHFFKHSENRGKGAAVRTAIQHADSLGFSHCLQIDADGQHNPDDIAQFIDAAKAQPNAIICGHPVFDDDAPKARLYGRKFTDLWVAIETLSLSVKDSLCGFRLYPVIEIQRVFDQNYIGPRMDFDVELLVKSVWSGLQLTFIKTRVNYIAGGVSHFHYIRDNVQLSKLHIRLLCGMVKHIPAMLYRKFMRQPK